MFINVSHLLIVSLCTHYKSHIKIKIKDHPKTKLMSNFKLQITLIIRINISKTKIRLTIKPTSQITILALTSSKIQLHNLNKTKGKFNG